MELEYNLSNEDSFINVLFASSQSLKIKKKKRREQYIYPAVYLTMLGILFYINNSPKGILITIILTSIWISLYPYLSRYSIRKKYFKNIGKEQSSDIKIKIKVDKDHFLVSDETGESRIKTTEIDKIIEIKNYFFIRINSTVHLIIPKNQFKDGILDQFIKKVQKWSKNDITEMPDWKWS